MAVERWFYRTDAEWNAIAERLKQMACPHCRMVGALIRHGHLCGYDETSPQRKTLRARRIFCSNRHRRQGCGRTSSVWLADKIRRLSLTTRFLWNFLQRAVAGSIAAAIRDTKCHLCFRSLQHVWRRFNLGQSQIRTALSGRGGRSPPDLASQQPAAQVLAHLQTAFTNADDPITEYQLATQTFFM